MADSRVVDKLLQQLAGNTADQALACDNIRDLSLEKEYCIAFGEKGAVIPLIGLLNSDTELSIKAARALRQLAEEDYIRPQIVEADGISSLVGLLQEGESHSSELKGAVLQATLALAVDETSRLAFNKANGVPVIVKILETSDNQELLDMACQLLGRLSHNKLMKNSVREQGGITQMLKLLQRPSTGHALSETIVQALTILVVDNEVNQDHIRDQYGIEPVVKLLDSRPSISLASSATTCLTAICINNDANKNQLRELWAIPLLVNLLEQSDSILVEKAVDCLRILTTGNDMNKLSLFSIPVGVRSLVRIMTTHEASEMITERAAAVIGNLSTTEQFFSAIRECGGLQRLVTLLDSGPESRVTEIAAKTLANMAGNDHNRKGIRLAGGLPPLMHLLTQRPSEQVLLATEEALKRLQVTNIERNAVLETLRYCDQRQEALVNAAAAAEAEIRSAENGYIDGDASVPRPLTQFSVEQTCSLLKALGIRDTGVFEANGVTGGDLLELTPEEMVQSLNLAPLQAKKLRNVTSAFEAFERIAATPGKAEITVVELRDWLQRQGRSDEDVQAIINGFKRAIGTDYLALLSFDEFARHYQWFVKTLQVMVLAADEALDVKRMPSLTSVGSAALSPPPKLPEQVKYAANEQHAAGNGSTRISTS